MMGQIGTPIGVVGTVRPILKLIAGILGITLAGRLQGGFILQNWSADLLGCQLIAGWWSG